MLACSSLVSTTGVLVGNRGDNERTTILIASDGGIQLHLHAWCRDRARSTPTNAGPRAEIPGNCRWRDKIGLHHSGETVVFRLVNLLKKTFVLGMIAFWALMTNHCGLELLSGLEFLACAPESESTPHQPNDCGDESDACATIESGQYKAEEGRIAAVSPPLIAVSFAFLMLCNLTALEPSTDLISPESSPPELVRVWQFTFRTALPPRAPSLIS